MKPWILFFLLLLINIKLIYSYLNQKLELFYHKKEKTSIQHFSLKEL